MDLSRRGLLQLVAGTSLAGLVQALAPHDADAVLVEPTVADVQRFGSAARSPVFTPTSGLCIDVHREGEEPRTGPRPLFRFHCGPGGYARWVARPGDELVLAGPRQIHDIAIMVGAR